LSLSGPDSTLGARRWAKGGPWEGWTPAENRQHEGDDESNDSSTAKFESSGGCDVLGGERRTRGGARARGRAGGITLVAQHSSGDVRAHGAGEGRRSVFLTRRKAHLFSRRPGGKERLPNLRDERGRQRPEDGQHGPRRDNLRIFPSQREANDFRRQPS